MRYVRPAVTAIGLAAIALGTLACHSTTRAASPPAAAPVSNAGFAFATHVDPQRPASRLLVTPAVAAVDVPAHAALGRVVTTVFEARSGASCDANVVYAGGARQSLGPAVADAKGFVRWTWMPVTSGQATAMVVCSGGQRGEVPIRAG